MKGFSILVLIFAIDAIVGLAQGNNMYSLKPGGTTGVVVDVITLVVCLVLGPGLWQAAKRRDWRAAVARYEEEGDDSGLREWQRTYR